MAKRVPITSESANLMGADRKRIVLLLRSVVIATSAYVVLADPGRPEIGIRLDQAIFVALFVLSNVALAIAPRRWFELPQFGPLLLLTDTAFILFGLAWRQGMTQDLLFVYFFTVFLITVGESLVAIAIGGALVSGVYGDWLWTHGNLGLNSSDWLRIPFFFLVAIFYGSLTERLKEERRRRESAERESQHLRLLLDVAGIFSETNATREFVHGISRFVEAACPEMRCEVVLADAVTTRVPGRVAFEIATQGHRYGELAVRTVGARELSERERWLCQIVAHAAAGALFGAEQSDAAKAAAEIKEQFLATVSHELRTPLHAILGYTDLIETSLPEDDPTLSQSIKRMRVNVSRLQDLVDQVLGFAELRAGQRGVRAEELSVSKLIGDLAAGMPEYLVGKPVVFSWRVAPDVDAISTDRRKLRQVLVCLLGNAAKFTEAGRIVLSVNRLQDGGVEFVIADSGIGIESSDLSTVFDEFRQVDGSLTRPYGGLGMGLTFARELVLLLGGSMDLESRLGEGTTVRVRLPRVFRDPHAPAVASVNARSAPSPRRRVASVSCGAEESWPRAANGR